MIVGTGIDCVEVSRVAPWLEDRGLCQRFFHEEELATVRSRGEGAARSLAARFAAKEAFIKALGRDFENMELKHIWVRNEDSGRPRLIVEEMALKAMERSGARHVHLSLAHEGNLAVAQVILEA